MNSHDKRFGLLLIVSILISVFFVIGIFVYAYSPINEKVIVSRNQNDTHKDWYMVRHYQSYVSQRVYSGLSRGSVPSGAYNIDCHTTIHRDMNSNHTYSDEDCNYTINTWRNYHQTRSYGNWDDEISEPPHAEFTHCDVLVPNSGCQREVDQVEQHWRIWFKVWDNDTEEYRNYMSCDVSFSNWDIGFDVGTIYTVNRNRAQGWLCNSLSLDGSED